MSYEESNRLAPEIIKHIGVLGQRGKKISNRIKSCKMG